jgi:hypothetical protein
VNGFSRSGAASWIGGLRWPRLARFINFLQFDACQHDGKSGADGAPATAELLKMPKAKSVTRAAARMNRHLSFSNGCRTTHAAKARESIQT